MKHKKTILFAAVSLALVALSAYAIVVTKTYRTTAVFLGIYQTQISPVPQYAQHNFAGWNLVNLAMGRAAGDTNFPDQVLAMTFDCGTNDVSLVVYDSSASNVVATIATNLGMRAVHGVGVSPTSRTNEVEHFVARLEILANNITPNGLLGGFFTVAGRVQINPVTGCPKPVLVNLDRDKLDHTFGYYDVTGQDDPSEKGKKILRTGLAHLIGVVDEVNGGNTNAVLVPYGALTIRGDRPVAGL